MYSIKRKSIIFRTICCLLAFLLIQSSLEQVQAQPMPFLPVGQGYFVDLSSPYSLPVLRGMRVYPNKPFEFDFVVDSSNKHAANPKETSLLIKYFLTCLTVPEEDLWVNLSPYESGRIIPEELSLTDAGNTLLEQDKLLKEIASSLTYPESRLGKKFWEQVYKKAQERFGTTDLPINTYNKVWIVPDKAIVYDMGNSAMIGETHLKVMLDEDYLALKKHNALSAQGASQSHAISSLITKEIILPELEKEINTGKNFAPVRQIFHSMVLASWFKRALKRNILSSVYVNKKKISGVDGIDKNAKEEIYKQYLRIYKVGAYNYIREDVDPITQQVMPRKYFSGGFSVGDPNVWMKTLRVPDFNALKPYLDRAQTAGSSYAVAKVILKPIGNLKDLAQLTMTRRSFVGALASMMITGSSRAQGVPRDAIPSTVVTSVVTGEQTISVELDGKPIPAQMKYAPTGSSYLEFAGDTSRKPVEGIIKAKNTGFVKLIDPNKTEYKKGEKILTVEDADLIAQRTGKVETLKTMTSRLALLQNLKDKEHAVSEYEVNDLRQKVGELQQSLDQDNIEVSAGIITAPHDMTIIDIKKLYDPTGQLKATQGEELFHYYDHDRVRIDLVLPFSETDLSNIDLMVNGKKVQNVFVAKWEFDPDIYKEQVILYASLDEPLDAGVQKVAVEVKINHHTGSQTLQDVPVRGAHAKVNVGKLEVKVIPAPGAGLVNYKVDQGAKVKAGDVLAEINTKTYKDQLRNLEDQILNITDLLKATAPTDTKTPFQFKLREQRDALKNQIDLLMPKRQVLLEQINAMTVRAPYDGIIAWSAQHESQYIRQNDKLFVINPDTVLLGSFDNSNINNRILLSSPSKINVGDAVLVETKQGVRLLGQVNAIDPNALSTSINLNGANQAVQISIFDPQNTLRFETSAQGPAVSVQVTLLNAIDKDALIKAGIQVATASPLPSRPVALPSLVRHTAPVTSSASFSYHAPQFYYTAPKGWQSYNPDQTAVKVIGNNLNVSGSAYLQWLKSAEDRKKPGAFQFSLLFYGFDNNGKFTFSPGLEFGYGAARADVYTGNALNPLSGGIPIIGQIAGNIMYFLSGTQAKQQKQYDYKAQADYYDFLSARYTEINGAQKLLIDLGRIQQEIVQKEGLLLDLQEALRVMQVREQAGFAISEDRARLERDVETLQQQIPDLKTDMVNKTFTFNNMTGKDMTSFKDPVFAAVPWDGVYSTISDTRARKMIEGITSQESKNPLIRQAVAKLYEIKQSAELQGLKDLPELNITGIFANTNPATSTFNIVPGTTETAANITPSTGIFNGRLDFWNGNNQIEKAKFKLDVENAGKVLIRARRDLAVNLLQVINDINSLSAQVAQAESAYQSAYSDWKSLADNPGLILPYQLTDARQKVSEKWEVLVNNKARYWQAQADLWKLGIMSPWAAKAEVTDKAQLSIPSIIKKTALIVSLAVMSLTAMPPDTFGASPQELWDRQSPRVPGSNKAAVDDIGRTLIDGGSIIERMEALKIFFKYYQNNNESIRSLENILLQTPHQDVAEELFRFMVARKDHDLRFFIQMINRAATENKVSLLVMAQQSLEDVLVNDPKIFEDLSEADFTANPLYPDVSSMTAKKAFLTVITADPDSMAADRLLQSHYWTSADLAKIYNELGRTGNLAGLIYDSILRNEALANISTVFTPSLYEHISSWSPWQDFISGVRLRELPAQTRSFLKTSPQWREMKGYIHPDLYKRALQATNDLITDNPAGPSSVLPYSYPQNQNDSFLDIFNSLNPSGQQEYIANSASMPELARILQSRTPLRENTLDRLMASPYGRILVMKVYLGSEDIGLLESIETRDWVRTIKADAQALQDTASGRIFRGALEKMYRRTKAGWAADARLDILSALELHSATDPRGPSFVDAQIKSVATNWGIQALDDQDASNIVPYVGYATRTPQVTSFLGIVTREREKRLDPKGFDDWLEKLVQNGSSGARGTGADLISIRDTIAGEIRNNDQDIPALTALVRYFLEVLGFFTLLYSSFKAYHWIKKKRANVPELIGILGGEMSTKGKGKSPDRAMISVSEDMYASAFKPLKAWQEKITHWSPNTSSEELLNDLNAVLNNAADVLRVMPYSPDLVLSKSRPLNAEYNKSYATFFELAAYTLYQLSERLQDIRFSDDSQRLRFKQDTDTMMENMKYVARYLRILQYRGNINTVMRYKYEDHSWVEWHGWGIYAWARRVLIYNRLWRISERKFKEELPVLLDEGNALIPYLYENPQGTVDTSIGRLQDVIRHAKTFSDSESPGGNKQEGRSFFGRVLVLGGIGSIIVTGVAVFFDIPWLITGASFSSIVLTLLGVGNFWKANFSTLYMAWNRTMGLIMDKLDARLSSLLDPSGASDKGVPSDEKIVALAKQDGLKEIAKELDPANAPRVDAIVIISENPDDMDALKQHRNSLRKKLVRDDIPVVVMAPANKGSGNAYFEALSLMKQKFESKAFEADELQGQYFGKLKPWQDARVMFIFHGKEAAQNDTLIDWGIANGYRAAASMSWWAAKEGKGTGADIIIFSRDIYFGPIEWSPRSDITLLTSRVSHKDLKTLGWVDNSFPQDGQQDVYEMREKMDLEKDLVDHRDRVRYPRGKRIVHDLESKQYDLKNLTSKQFSAFNGIMMIGPEVAAMNARIADDFQKVGLMERMPLHLTSDVLIPILKGRNLPHGQWDREINDYVEERVTWPDMTGLAVKQPKAILKGIYNIIRHEMDLNIKAHAYVPHPRAEVYLPNMTAQRGANETIRKLLSGFDRKAPGGIDLNFQPQFIQRPAGTSPEGIQDAVVPDMPGEFKGFDFNIVRFTPQLTANGAFQLMFNSN